MKPSEPNRLVIVGAGWALGLCVGLGLAALKEMLDDSIRSEQSLLQSVPIPILVHVPVLKSRTEIIRKRLLRAGEAMATIVLFAASVGMGIYIYLAG